MPETVLKRVSGQRVAVIVAKAAAATTPLSNWTKFGADVEIGEDEASAASSKFEQFTPGKKKAVFKFEGYIGAGETLASLPQPGDKILTLAARTITEGSDLMQDFGDPDEWGDVVVTKVSYEQTDKPGTYSFEARTGGTED